MIRNARIMCHNSRTTAEQEWEGPQPPIPLQVAYSRETLSRGKLRHEPISDFVETNHDRQTAFQNPYQYTHAVQEVINHVPRELSCPPRRPVPSRSSTDLERGGHEPLLPRQVAQPHTRLPLKQYAGWYRRLRWTIFTIYGRLYMLVFLANFAAMIYRLCQPDIFDRPATLFTAVSVILMITVLVRQEHVVNFLFWSLGKTPKWFP